MSKTETKTYDEFIKDLMTFSRQGALIQPFVIQALQFFSEAVLVSHESGILSERMRNSFVHPEAWADCAREILEKMDVQYGNS
ncbi:MAG: hypothetical protein LBJ14_10400 [Desulfarculales bacterium]|jgi:hypothetical protein|nr:hypothetical protein [Desulfarculales bacterium]